MDGAKIIGTLESMGFTFGLAIDYESPGRLTAEAVALLDMLKGQKESAIDYLISGRFKKRQKLRKPGLLRYVILCPIRN